MHVENICKCGQELVHNVSGICICIDLTICKILIESVSIVLVSLYLDISISLSEVIILKIEACNSLVYPSYNSIYFKVWSYFIINKYI